MPCTSQHGKRPAPDTCAWLAFYSCNALLLRLQEHVFVSHLKQKGVRGDRPLLSEDGYRQIFFPTMTMQVGASFPFCARAHTEHTVYTPLYTGMGL